MIKYNDRNQVRKLVGLLFTTSRLIRDRAKPGKAPDPFSMIKLKTLDYIRETGNPLMKDVAAHLCITPPSATTLVDTLVRAKLLARSPDRVDRRLIRLTLTPRGGKVLLRGQEEVRAHMARLLEHLTPQEKKSLVAILEKIAHRYQS